MSQDTTNDAMVFVRALEMGAPIMTPAPAAVVAHIRAARPDLIRERAWLVMFYSIVLSWVTSNQPDDTVTKQKLKCNLWLAFNDARLLLEPSEVNIQALILLAVHVEDFTSPSLCWMLTSTAARMLQALGINHRRLDAQTRERRSMLFWWLEVIDKGLALTFARPPTNQRAMTKSIPVPALDQLLTFKPHVKNHNVPALFGAHYLYQMMVLTKLLGDVWVCLYDDLLVDEHVVALRLDDVERWYDQACEILRAAAKTEKPFLDEEGARSIDIGVTMVDFQYCWLCIQLCRPIAGRRDQLLHCSISMLSLLPGLVAGSEEVFNGIVWQTLCSPFSAFLALFKELTKEASGLTHDQRNQYLKAMECLPAFLKAMAAKNRLAAKLARIASTLMEQAKATPQKRREKQPTGETSGIPFPDVFINWDTLLLDEALLNPTSQQSSSQPAAQMSWDQLVEPWTDWLGFDEQIRV